MKYIARLTNSACGDMWLMPSGGNPDGRTYTKECATVYASESAARAALTNARKVRPKLSAVIEPAWHAMSFAERYPWIQRWDALWLGRTKNRI